MFHVLVCSVRDAVVHVPLWSSGYGCVGRGLQKRPVPADQAGLSRASGQRKTDSHQNPEETAEEARRQRLPILL